jgi:hypothetical protein
MNSIVLYTITIATQHEIALSGALISADVAFLIPLLSHSQSSPLRGLQSFAALRAERLRHLRHGRERKTSQWHLLPHSRAPAADAFPWAASATLSRVAI